MREHAGWGTSLDLGPEMRSQLLTWSDVDFPQPLGRFLGEKPSGSHRRPLFCLCYPTIAPRLPNGTLVNKAAVQAPRALYFGYHGHRCGSFEQTGIERSQPGYACFIPSDDFSCGRQYAGQIVITPHVRFVPDCHPGLKRLAGGGGDYPGFKNSVRR